MYVFFPDVNDLDKYIKLAEDSNCNRCLRCVEIPKEMEGYNHYWGLLIMGLKKFWV